MTWIVGQAFLVGVAVGWVAAEIICHKVFGRCLENWKYKRDGALAVRGEGEPHGD